MADTHFTTHSQDTMPQFDATPSSKRRKVIGQCPVCQQSFSSRHELRAHMADHAGHAPAYDSDDESFSEPSSLYNSAEEQSYPFTSKQTRTRQDDEPTLNSDGFEFSSANASPNLQQDGFEFIDADAEPGFFSAQMHSNAESGSVHTVADGDEQPSAEYTPIEIPPSRPRVPKGGALGVLYCGTCDRGFGNEKVFKRHFIFGAKHGQEPQDMQDLYYRVWGSSWADEVREMGRKAQAAEADKMEV